MLIALLQPDHAHHAIAHDWWSMNRKAGWASCPLTQNGFIRIISQPKYPRPVPVARALDLLAEEIQGSDHNFWADDLSLLDTERFVRDRILGPKQLTDVYLLALAVKNGGRFVTFDRAIPAEAVRDSAKQHIVVI